MTRTAEALDLARSAVSHATGALEDGFGVRLFNRVGRGIELTEAGCMFPGAAPAVGVGRAERGVLLVAASQTIAGHRSIFRPPGFTSDALVCRSGEHPHPVG